ELPICVSLSSIMQASYNNRYDGARSTTLDSVTEFTPSTLIHRGFPPCQAGPDITESGLAP
ncbi:MAG: hypothetical protein ACO23E_11355, partial [Steroidobacteraceae bacterium]